MDHTALKESDCEGGEQRDTSGLRFGVSVSYVNSRCFFLFSHLQAVYPTMDKDPTKKGKKRRQMKAVCI